jgi:hypothetical protein
VGTTPGACPVTFLTTGEFLNDSDLELVLGGGMACSIRIGLALISQ